MVLLKAQFRIIEAVEGGYASKKSKRMKTATHEELGLINGLKCKIQQYYNSLNNVLLFKFSSKMLLLYVCYYILYIPCSPKNSDEWEIQ